MTIQAQRLTHGSTVENGALRIHRYADVLVLWDLTNAGKRGRQVAVLHARPPYSGRYSRDAVVETMSALVENLDSMAAAIAVLEQFSETHLGAVEFSHSTSRGIDVQPAGFQPITIRTPRLEFEVGHQTFVVTDLTDKNNVPTCIPGNKSKRTIEKLYQWANANRTRIEGMSFREVREEMRALGVDYHYYCAMD